MGIIMGVIAGICVLKELEQYYGKRNNKMKRIILAVIIVSVLLGVFYTATSANFPPPPECPNCQNGWSELFYIPDSKYCSGGDYYIWHCRELDSKDVLYTSVCLSSIQLDEIYTVYIPWVTR